MQRLLILFLALTFTAMAGAAQRDSRSPSGGVELSIAAPPELNSALNQLARAFEQKTGDHVRFTFADSPNLIAQVRSGSAFDVVFLPDMQEVRLLAASGFVTAGSITEYARDTMILCFAPGVRIEPRPGDPLLLLTAKNIPRVAVASPATAFGKATVQALTAIHIYDVTIRRKLVISDTIAGVAQLIQNGSADVAVLPGSALEAYQLRSTQVISVASARSSQLRKGAGVLKRSQHPQPALALLKFAISPEGKAIFRDAGFD
jgi:molybdate transport system substrate-binding protein